MCKCSVIAVTSAGIATFTISSLRETYVAISTTTTTAVISSNGAIVPSVALIRLSRSLCLHMGLRFGKSRTRLPCSVVAIMFELVSIAVISSTSLTC